MNLVSEERECYDILETKDEEAMAILFSVVKAPGFKGINLEVPPSSLTASGGPVFTVCVAKHHTHSLFAVILIFHVHAKKCGFRRQANHRRRMEDLVAVFNGGTSAAPSLAWG